MQEENCLAAQNPNHPVSKTNTGHHFTRYKLLKVHSLLEYYLQNKIEDSAPLLWWDLTWTTMSS